MAESTSSPPTQSAPVLQSTADQSPYVPVSWLAAAAAGVAGLFALLLAVMGIIAFRARRPLLEEPLLVFAVIAIVLSFAARRVVRNSEGTRTGTLFGIDLPNTAWWAGLVLGLGYGSYLLAIEYSVRNDAKNEVQVWTDFILKGDPESLGRAFHRTQDPSQRKGIPPTDLAQMEGRWGKDFTAFKQCELVRLVERNPGCKIELGGLRTWKFSTNVECTYSAVLTCPEGIFPLQLPLRGTDTPATGTEGGGGRLWQIGATSNYIDREHALLTPYGWYVLNLTYKGSEYGHRFVAACGTTREVRSGAFLEFGTSTEDDRKFLGPLTLGAAQARAGAFGIPAAYSFTPGPEFLDRSADKLFTLPGGAKPDADKNKIFRNAWNTVGIVKAGDRLRESTDTNDQLVFTATGVELRVPIEIPLPAARGDAVAARGKLILECPDPAIFAEAKRLRDSAVPSEGTNTPGQGISLQDIPWRVVRIESDLKPVRMEQKPGMQGPPTPPPPV